MKVTLEQAVLSHSPWVKWRCGVPVPPCISTRLGLISSRRTQGNQRRYTRDDCGVAFIRVAQRVGIALVDIEAALATCAVAPSRADWGRLSTAWRADLDERIAQLQKLRDTLDDCIGCGCLSIDQCRLRNPFDKLAAKGPGPQRLLVRRRATD
jgi:MerR family redox-sensitive transcriptional activator SoxR